MVNLLETNPFNNKNKLPSPIFELSLYDLCQLYPQRIKKLFRNLNLEKQGLEKVRIAVQQQRWVIACERLVEYYQSNNFAINVKGVSSAYFDKTSQDTARISPDLILENTFIFQGHISTVPCDSEGHLDWSWRGYNHDDEWAWFLNRHYHLINLFSAYQKSGELKYVHHLNYHLLDWITSSFSKSSQNWAYWRGREVALRVFHWIVLFYGLSSVEELLPSVRILMLSSLLDHACYLRHLHHWGANWICREMGGLVAIALGWQEFKKAPQWLSYAIQKVLKELDAQVYPDGVHKELTSHYHRVVLQDFQTIFDLLQLTGNLVPPPLSRQIEQMVDYLAYSISPNGRSVQNNDSDQDDNRDLIRHAAVTYERPDWIYIANQEKMGSKPTQLSVGFPWAGQVISRSGWDQQAHWSFFDIGSLGINYHVHYDKLHLSVAAYGRHLLIDSGRYCYRRDHFWKYFRHSASHNVILIDGYGQGLDDREQLYSLAPNYVLTPKFDFAWGQFSGKFPGLKGRTSHIRSLIYIRNKFWVVVDHIKSDRPRTIQPLWHFHPECQVVIEDESVVSTDPEVGNLRIIPVATFPWQIQLVKGQLDPVQGWWSREYNHLEPNPTAVYSAKISDSEIFAWVLYPGLGAVPKIDTQVLFNQAGSIRISIVEPTQERTEIAVCLDKSSEIVLSNGLILQGKCAILTDDQPPFVALGTLWDQQGHEISRNSALNSNPLSKGDIP